MHILRNTLSIFVMCCLVLNLGACGASREKTLDAAKTNKFIRKDITTGTFTLASWQRIPSRYQTKQNATIHIYIEGDGRAWIRKTQPSPDPTPRNPVSLKLAIKDKHPQVAYLARPCQYVHCDTKTNYPYWTYARFAPEVVNATIKATRKLAREAQAKQVILIGYSGGGVLAALVAERLKTVAGLITVAAPLDVESWTTHHGISPLSGSLKPLEQTERLRSLPQVHIAGQQDIVVPPSILKHYAKKLRGTCLRLDFRNNTTHGEGWQNRWLPPELPKCTH